MSDEEMAVNPANLADAAKGTTDTIVVTHGKAGGRRVRSDDLPTAMKQAGVKQDWQGTLVVAFPDVCKTPAPGGPVPIPYPNVSKGGEIRKALAQGGFKNVRVHTMGDAAGAAKGLGARAFTGGAFVTPSLNVQAEGKPMVMAHEMTHALQQSHVPHVVPSQSKAMKPAP